MAHSALTSTNGTLPPPTEINDDNKVISIAIFIAVSCVLTGLIVLWRLWARFRTKSFGLDDYAIIPALPKLKLFYIGWSVMAIYVNLHAGVGKPLQEITIGEYSIWFKGIVGSMWLYPVMTMTIRLSILLFYQRIFGNDRSTVLNWIIQALILSQVIYFITYSIIPAFVSIPLYRVWEPMYRIYYMNDMYYYHSQLALFITSMLFDIILLFLPVYPIMRLQMPLHRRVGVVVLLVMGAGASIAAAVKLRYFIKEMTRYKDPRSVSDDWIQWQMSNYIPPPFDHYGETFWLPSQIEPTVGLIGASIPGIRQGITQVLKTYTDKDITLKSRSTLGTGITRCQTTHIASHEASSEEVLQLQRKFIPFEDWGGPRKTSAGFRYE